MKKIIVLYLLIIPFLFSCSDDDDKYSTPGKYPELNESLIGHWKEVDGKEYSRNHRIFYEDFKLDFFSYDEWKNDTAGVSHRKANYRLTDAHIYTYNNTVPGYSYKVISEDSLYIGNSTGEHMKLYHRVKGE